MHELYLAESILNIIQDYAKRDGFKKVNSVMLSYGRFSCMEPKALQFAFEVQAAGTAAEGAVLEFKIMPAVIHCFSCEKDLEIKTHTGICPGCGGGEVMLTAGTEELQILEMDVD
ncbi:MAG: hydrogenase maturation nickel metallochaperone HypA [Deltaproteobacteria bacterium HGW-Deltaproteobacteria-13]|jgi:hydrogenase nickel incorporation protein HypA/HybF|nr:MAG: hydrogenase maturation nickel metallochaperone HypA [Deltaproteobacteria bacterium HGW-Deltaproteobacteria-13]